ncbi:MAG: tetratricopeptide repeat protein [Ardenticatenaceae bacterium]|nr:tetratricopeptide repeat protein [Ardenticatenaceae bacterium]
MAQIALHDYLEQINRFLEDEQPTEAITHSRYLLKQYPRHVDTYRLLGRALLENREFDDALEIFQRILSADPNDFVAYVGLSEIHREKGNLAEAIWYMERAYEMSPYDAALQEVLRELYFQRDNEVPDELPLTRAALARIYFQGELYQQASDELRSILGQNGDDRVDLQILLAETLWRDNQRVDAVDVSLKVLEKLPDSITVNAILGEIWLLTGRTEEAQTYLQRLQALTQVDLTYLDPDSVVGHAFRADGAPALPQTISVEQWRETADKIRVDKEPTPRTEQPIEDEAIYDWLRDTRDTSELVPVGEEQDSEVDWFRDRKDELPAPADTYTKTAEWLESMGVEPESGDDFQFADEKAELAAPPAEDDLPFVVVDDSLDWVKTEHGLAAEDAVDALPDWLNDLDARQEPVAADEEEETDWFAAALDDGEDELEESDWFSQAAGDEEPESVSGAKPLSTADLLSDIEEVDFDWLTAGEAQSETMQFVEDTNLAPEVADESDWFTAETGETAEEGVVAQPEADVFADWMNDLEAIDEDVEGVEMPKLAESETFSTDDLLESDVPDWLYGDLDEVGDDAHVMAAEDLDVSTDELFESGMEAMPDWLMGEDRQEEDVATDELLASALDTNALFGDFEDVPAWLDDEGYSEKPDEPMASGLISHMNRMMGTADLDDDFSDISEFEVDEEEEEAAESSGLTDLLLGSDDDEESLIREAPEEIEEKPGRVFPGGLAGLLGTAELLADLGEELPDWLQDDAEYEDDLEEPVLHTADLQGQQLEEVPHWLFREEDGVGEQPGAVVSDDEDELSVVDAIDTAELFASLGEEVPDWISGINDDEIDDVPVSGASGIIGTDELLSELDADLPEWMNESDVVSEPLDLPDVGAGDVLDEMGLGEVESGEDEGLPPLPTKSLLDWLSSQTEANDDVLPEAEEGDEFPEWLMEEGGKDEREAVIMTENEHEFEMDEMPDDSDGLDWLNELASEADSSAKPEKKPDDADEGLSDWLSGLTEPATDSEAALMDAEDEVPLMLTDTDLPDWLKDLGEASSAPAQAAITGSLENLPDWLKPPEDMDLGLPKSTGPIEADESVLASLDDEDALDWLGDVAADEDEGLLEVVGGDLADVQDSSDVWLDALAADDGDELADWLTLVDEGADDLGETAVAEDAVAEVEDEAFADLFAEPVEEGSVGFTDLIADLESAQAEDTFDWLSDLTTDESGLPEEEELLPEGSVEVDEFMALFGEADESDDLFDMPEEDELLPEGSLEADEFMALFGEADEADDLFDMPEGDELLPEGSLEADEFMALFGDGDDADGLFDMPEADDLLPDGPVETAEFMALFGDADEDPDLAEEEAESVGDVPDWLMAAAGSEPDTIAFSLEGDEETADEDLDLFAAPESDLFAFADEEDESELPEWLTELGDDVEAVAEPEDMDEETADEDVSGWLAELAADNLELGAEDEEELPDWLRGTAGAGTGELTGMLSHRDDEDDLFADSDDLAFVFEDAEDEPDVDAEEAVPDWLTASAGSDADELAAETADTFLDEPFDLEAEAFIETTAASGDEEAVLEDPMAWLDQLASEQDESVEELPSILDTSMYDSLVEEEGAEQFIDLPDDPEAAMQMLEALAQEQQTELEEEMPLLAEMDSVPDADLLEMLEFDEPAVAEEEADVLVSDLLAEVEGDEEGALAWLDAFDDEDIEADLPTLVEDAEESFAEDADLVLADLAIADDEPALSWLDALDESDVALGEEMETADTDDSLETVEVPDDLEEAMAWLDNLEADDEVEEPFEELPTLDELAVMDAEIDADEMMAVPVEAEDEIDWLSALAEEVPELEPEPVLETADMAADEEADEIDWLSALAEEQADESVEEAAAEVVSEPEPVNPLQESLNRLEELALQDMAAVTVEVTEDAVPYEAESLDDVLDWLEAQLAVPEPSEEVEVEAEVGDAVDEAAVVIEEPIIDEELDTDVAEETVMETAVAEPAATEMPDLEIADEADDMAGLFDDMSDDMSDDDILAFMDSVLGDADSFVPEKDVSFTPDDPNAVPSFYSAPTAEVEIEEVVEETAVVEPIEVETPDLEAIEEPVVEEMPEDEADEMAGLFDDMSDDMSDDDILAFMDSVLGDADSFVPEKDVSFTPDDPNAVPSFYSVPTAEVEIEEVVEETAVAPDDLLLEEAEDAAEADLLDGMFDDMSDDMSDDDILSFMDAIFDDDDSFVPEKDVSFTPDDPNAVPSFYGASVVEAEEPEAAVGDVPDDPDEAIAWLQDLADTQDVEARSFSSVEDLDEILPEIDDEFAADLLGDMPVSGETAVSEDALNFDDTVADSLPDWLEFGGEERMPGHTDWLRSLPEPDVAGWLEAEEEVMSSSIFDEIPVPSEPERPLPTYTPLFESTLQRPETEPFEEIVEEEEEVSTAVFNISEGALDQARQALARGNYDGALTQYRQMIEHGHGLSALIADLESAASEHEQQPRLRRVLGDAYMRNGQLQRALETYRIALDEL